MDDFCNLLYENLNLFPFVCAADWGGSFIAMFVALMTTNNTIRGLKGSSHYVNDGVAFTFLVWVPCVIALFIVFTVLHYQGYADNYYYIEKKVNKKQSSKIALACSKPLFCTSKLAV